VTASAGEIIAVLGLFERVVLELRNYRDAPAHFQQLSVELDLLSSTLSYLLSDQSHHGLHRVVTGTRLTKMELPGGDGEVATLAAEGSGFDKVLDKSI
jgi:hypothetical protein